MQGLLTHVGIMQTQHGYGGNEGSKCHIADPLARGLGNETSSSSGLALASFFPLGTLSFLSRFSLG